MRITLTVTAGPHKGRVFTFVGHDTFLVGRSKRAHFRLPVKDRNLSRIHFLVEVNPPYCRLMDTRSRNGTYINGQRVTVADLKDGDQIRAGRTMLRLTVENNEPLGNRVVALVSQVQERIPADLGTLNPQHLGSAPPGPPPQSIPSVPPLPKPKPVAERCVICGASMSRRAPAPNRSAAYVPPLCPTCQDQIRIKKQPVPGYQIVRELGRGGMGIVYLALQTAKGIPVALKTALPAPASTDTEIQRFLREANILHELRHPHIVSFLDMGQANGMLFFAMDYVPGTDAHHLLNAKGPLPVAQAVGLVGQLLEALEYAHAKGFVHRDIKPANLLVTKVDSQEWAKLSDFGLARVYQTSLLSGLTIMGDIGGTYPFMAPEQLTNFREAKPSADQYSAGATLYNLLTGHYVFDVPSQAEEWIVMVLQDEPAPIRSRRADISQGLADLIHRAIAKEPAQRFPNVREMRKALAKHCP